MTVFMNESYADRRLPHHCNLLSIEVPYYVSPSSPIKGERVSELESLGLENLGLELENDAFEDTALGKETTGRTEASNQSPIYEDETCGLSDETCGLSDETSSIN
ncbi:hypothetical protein L3X38_026293 [Prunus dulcis]|uniref:Uncharacterized protein n=1 Tax=Prunus dulcis TaxID=3755 RepID=A0AAD4YJF1_PRUDU|nr:hypothetical protein L3X38_026293 [Prunus dulcis]